MTAVEWLAKELYEKFEMIGSGILFDEILDKAKEMEKKQIVNAWDDGDYAYFYSKKTGKDFDNGEEYYKEKYNQNQ